MATSKTSSFYLTDRVELTAAGTKFSSTVSVGSYVDVGDRQALAIEQVDFSVMKRDTTTGSLSYNITGGVSADATVGFQLSDLNPGTAYVGEDDVNLIAAGCVMYDDGNNVTSIGPALYPDIFGKLDEARMVVNDNLYMVANANTTYVANQDLIVYVRIKCRIVTLSNSDFMALAIQSTAQN